MSLTLIEGVEGYAIYLDNFRIAGPKPWGGGKVIREWRVRIGDVAGVLERIHA